MPLRGTRVRFIGRAGVNDSSSGRLPSGIDSAERAISVFRFGFKIRMLLPLLVVAPTNLMGSPNVTISGGADESGYKYTWTVTNGHDSPIIFVEFPQYKASVGSPPDGWEGELTNERGVGGRTGFFRSHVDTAVDGIAPGGSAVFRLALTTRGTPRGRGDVLIRFADETETRVRAVVPIKEAPVDRNVSLIGLSLIFAVFLIVRAAKRRKSVPPTNDATP